MPAPLLRSAFGLAALLAFAGVAFAGGPRAQYSYVSPRLIVCPAGDSEFVVIPRTVGGIPYPGSVVWIDVTLCPGLVLAPANGTESYSLDPTQHWLVAVVDASGMVTMRVRGGGTCADSLADVRVDGLPFGHRFVASPDQNGDLGVDATDVGIAVSKLGQADHGADFDGDGIVTAADVALVTAHVGHSAFAQPVATGERTWGRLKTLYH